MQICLHSGITVSVFTEKEATFVIISQQASEASISPCIRNWVVEVTPLLTGYKELVSSQAIIFWQETCGFLPSSREIWRHSEHAHASDPRLSFPKRVQLFCCIPRKSNAWD